MRHVPALALLSLATCLVPSGANAAVFVYEAFLSGANEAPPNASPGTGYALVTYDDVAHTLGLDISFSGLTAGNTAAHIHVVTDPPPATTGAVATTTPTFAGFPTGATAGNYLNVLDLTLVSSYRAGFITANGGTTAGAEAALGLGLADGRAYLNIHTTNFPGGEIRGFLLPPAIPEPASWALMIGGFALAGIALRMRQRIVRFA